MSRRRRLIQRLLAAGALGGSPYPITFLFRDDFTTDRAAGAVNGTATEPGMPAGTRVAVDTNSKLTISSARLQFATAGAAWGNPGYWGPAQTKAAGLTLASVFQGGVGERSIGWDTAQTGAISNLAINPAATNLNIWEAEAGALVHAFSTNTDYILFVVIAGSTNYLICNPASDANYRIIWVSDNPQAASVYPGVADFTNGVGNVDTIRVATLGAPWNTDHGIATSRLAGARAANDTFTHEANCNLRFTLTTRPSGGNVDFRFRWQDATNYLQLLIDSTGAYTLNEVVAGTPASLGTGTGAATGHIIRISCDGSSVRVFGGTASSVAAKIAATTTNFATATAGLLADEGTGGSISDIIANPRYITSASVAAFGWLNALNPTRA